MPFTPFHFGPGAAIKAVAPKHFSFTVFCFAQVATDCETAYYMYQAELPFHRFCHTLTGATLVGLGSVMVGRPLCQWALRIWSAWRSAPFRQYFPSSSAIPLGSAISGAFIGTYSHLLLDGIMHSDIMPLLPFTPANPFYQMVSPFVLHAGCILLGLLGAVYIASKNRDA